LLYKAENTIIKIDRINRPIDTKKKPITQPALKATLNPAVMDDIHSKAVLVLE